MTSAVTIPMLIVLFGLMGIAIDGDDVGTTLEDVICSVDSNSIACGGLEFEELKSTVLSSDIGDMYITNEHIAEAQGIEVKNYTLADYVGTQHPWYDDACEWIYDKYYTPIISKTDIVDANGNYVRFDYVLDEDFYNKYGKERYIFTAYTYTADGMLIDVTTQTMQGVSLSFYDDEAIINSQSASYYDEETGIYYIGKSDGTVSSYTMNIPEMLDITPDQLTAVETVIDGAIGGVEIGEEDIAIIGATPVDLTTATGEEAAELAIDIINAETLSDTTTDSTTTAPNYFNILEAIRNLLNGIKTGVSNILTNIKNIPANIITMSQTSVQSSLGKMEKSQIKLAEKLGVEAVKNNVNLITTTFFGERTFNDNGEVVISPVFENAEPITTDTPHLYFTLFGKKYDLFSGFGLINDSVAFFKKIVGAFLIAGFFLGLLRSIPSILMSVAEVRSVTNPTSITNLFESLNIHRPDVTDSRLHRTKPETTKKKG